MAYALAVYVVLPDEDNIQALIMRRNPNERTMPVTNWLKYRWATSSPTPTSGAGHLY